MSNESINAEEKQEPLSISSSAVPNASVKVISMADVPLLEVDWLWKPYPHRIQLHRRGGQPMTNTALFKYTVENSRNVNNTVQTGGASRLSHIF